MKRHIIAALFVASAPVNAAVVLDQNFLAPPGSYGGGQVYSNGTQSVESAQTFTVGTSGYLHHVDLLLGGFSSYDVTFRVRSVSGGVIDSVNANALTSVDFMSPQWGPGFHYSTVSIDLSTANLFFNAGDIVAISMEAVEGLPMVFGGWAGAGNGYAGGSAWGRTQRTASWGGSIGVGSGDLYFATYMSDEPTQNETVPEPGVLGLFAMGAAAIAASRRRQPAVV